MAQIAGIGIYIPRYRIEALEINRAWGRSGGKGRKAVAAFDEDPLTMGIDAAKNCLASAGVDGNRLDHLAFASISSGYAENTLAAQAAQVLGAPSSVQTADFGLTTRSVTSALISALDGIESERITSALVIASDKLFSEPGSSFELNHGAGAGAVLLSAKGFAEIESMASRTSGFVGYSRREGASHGLVDERFVMQHGYLDQAHAVVSTLQKNINNTEWDQVVLQAPDERWTSRLIKILKIAPEKLRSAAAQIGYAGSASFIIHLGLAFEAAKPGERILAVSYGPGGCDAVSFRMTSQPKLSSPLKEMLSGSEAISYPHYLRMNKLLRGEP